MLANDAPTIQNRYCFLALKMNVGTGQLDSQRLLVKYLKKTRSQLPVDSNRGSNNPIREVGGSQFDSWLPGFQIHHQIVPAVAVSSQPGSRGKAVVAIFC